MIRYRTGISSTTGAPLSGYAHLAQSLDKIIMTIPTERVMRLDFGLDPARRLGRNISPQLAAHLYRNLVTAIHKWEPEFRIVRMQLVSVDRTGGLAIYLEGRYFPEGRYGNYAVEEPANFNIPLALIKRGAA
ncbi:GPW/gp25 family protein [Methylocystis sp. WRRC1]|uniref:GPW/gp25 family protein n=1 Tax=unclassified Methylocystis TaxID=2625913 RepID=UPI0001F86A95|nr:MULTISPECIES: GPW/gp25 family protein [unclassified Methylocystis]MCC3246138.1 GPW/gp25 family protein [Methylocystis sp. WRRC1]